MNIKYGKSNIVFGIWLCGVRYIEDTCGELQDE